MGRKADQLRAELEVAEFEEALVAAKTVGAPTGDEYRQLKEDLRAARRRHRELREAGRG